MSILAVVMIASSHSADKKVFEIDRMNAEVMKLRSEYVAVRASVQQMRLESSVTERMKESGIHPSVIPPKKIRVASQK